MSKLTVYHGSPVIIRSRSLVLATLTTTMAWVSTARKRWTWQRSGLALLKRTAMPTSTLWICLT